MERRNYSMVFKNFADAGIDAACEALTVQDWHELFQDYCAKDFGSLREHFTAAKGDNLGLVVIAEFEGLASSVQKRMELAIDQLLAEFGNAKEPSRLDELLFCIRFLELKVDTEVLIAIVQNRDQPKHLREHAAHTLSVVQEQGLMRFWDSVDLAQDAFLAPAYARHFQSIDPLRVFRMLRKIQVEPDGVIEFEMPVYYSLLRLNIMPFEWEEVGSVLRGSPIWVSELVSRLLKEHNDLEVVARALAEPPQSEQMKEAPAMQSSYVMQKLILGSSVFPDLMLLELYKKWGLFEELCIELEIRYYSWNELHTALIRGDVHLIVGNLDVIEFLMNKGRSLRIWRELNRFNGWSIISRNKLGSPADFIDRDGLSEKEALKATLEQMKGKVVVAVAETDYALTFQDLFVEAGLNVDDVVMKGEFQDPHLAFLDFLNGTGDFFVGSEFHVMNAIAKGKGHRLLSEAKSDFGAEQENVIVAKEANGSFNKQSEWVEGLYTAFCRALDVGRLKVNDDVDSSIVQMHALFGKKMKEAYPDNYQDLLLNDRDFKQFIKDCVRLRNNRYTSLSDEANTVDFASGRSGRRSGLSSGPRKGR